MCVHYRVAVGVLGVDIGPSFQTFYNHVRLDVEVWVNVLCKCVSPSSACEFTRANTHRIAINLNKT